MAYEAPLPGGYLFSDALDRLDLAQVHMHLVTATYWARGRTELAVTERSFRHSIACGLHAPGGAMAGFARVVSDRTLRAHLTDVFVLPDHRGRGLGRAFVAAILAHPELATCRRWTLVTRDAHALYASFGFGPLANAQEHMTLLRPPSHTDG